MRSSFFQRFLRKLISSGQLPSSPESVGLPPEADVEPATNTIEDEIYAKLLRPGDICFDVGAHKGALSMFLAKIVGESGKVFAFEPVWPLFEAMCQSLQQDKSTGSRCTVVSIPWGLSDKPQTCCIHVPRSDYGLEFGVGSMAEQAAWSKAQDVWRVNQSAVQIESYQCQFVTLDSFLESSRVQPPTFLKIDVEGAEDLVLRGSINLFESGARPLMLIELFAPWEKAFGYQPWQPLSRLLACGYEILFVCVEGIVEHRPTESQPFPAEYANGYNIIAFHPTHHKERISSLRHLFANNEERVRLVMPPAPCPNRIEHLANQIEISVDVVNDETVV